MTDSISVLVIESQPLVRAGIRAVLDEHEDITIVGEAGSAGEGFTLFTTRRPDVLILALRMPDFCAIDELENYFREDPGARIIVLADRAGDAEITKALKLGASGYLTKDIEIDQLADAVLKVASGGRFIPEEIALVISENLGKEELTPTESNVLRMIVGGMSNKEIAFALDVSENTIKTHASNIFGKLGVSDRTSAATTAIRRGLVRVEL